MYRVYSFLEELNNNNNREWFNAHKNRYIEVKNIFEAFTEKLIERISAFDSEIVGVTVKESVFRIYRDTRFSKNKEPYKTHMGAYICRGGKSSEFSGYYFHIEPEEIDYIGGNCLVSGLHHPQPKILKSVREDILDNTENFLEVMKKAEGFEIDRSEMMKRMPKDFPADFPYAELLKNKNYYLAHYFDKELLNNSNLLDYCTEKFKSTYDFNKTMNRAVQYAIEEM